MSYARIGGYTHDFEPRTAEARVPDARLQRLGPLGPLHTLAKLIEVKDRDIRALQEFVARKDKESSKESSLYVASLQAHLAAKEQQLQTLHDLLRSAETAASGESVPAATKLP